jgi:hypothetical protein
MRLITALLLLISTYQLQAQDKKGTSWKIGFTNSQTARPFAKFSSLFHSPFHPGFELGYLKTENIHRNSKWEFEPAISYTFHRWVQHNIAVVVNQYYKHDLAAGFLLSARVGAGYQLSIPTSKVYRLSGETIKAKAFAGRSQFTFNAAFGVDKHIGKKGIMLGLLYQQKIQTPFVKNYVPLLPYNSMMIAVTIPVHNKTSL